MPTEDKYLELFQGGCKLVEGLIRVDKRPTSNLGFFDKRKLRKAIGLFEAAAAVRPRNGAPFFMLAKIKQRLGEFPESLDLLRKAWDLEPGNLVLLVELSGAYGLTGQHKDAIRVLEEGVKHFPDEPRVLFNLGISYLLDHQPRKAIDTFTRTVALEPDYDANHKLLAYSSAVAAGSVPPPKNQGEIARAL